jgi:predicted nucleotidyltransferase
MSHTHTDCLNEDFIATVAKLLHRVLEERSDIAAAYLLGSAQTGKMRSDSDIDIALLPVQGQQITLPARLELAAQLEVQLNRVIDIGVISAHNLVYASEAIINGRRIMTVQKDFTESTETLLLGSYITFRQDRKVVEESYRAA